MSRLVTLWQTGFFFTLLIFHFLDKTSLLCPFNPLQRVAETSLWPLYPVMVLVYSRCPEAVQAMA